LIPKLKKYQFEAETRKPEDSLQNPLALSKVIAATLYLKRSQIIANTSSPVNRKSSRDTKHLQNGGVL